MTFKPGPPSTPAATTDLSSLSTPEEQRAAKGWVRRVRAAASDEDLDAVVASVRHLTNLRPVLDLLELDDWRTIFFADNHEVLERLLVQTPKPDGWAATFDAAHQMFHLARSAEAVDILVAAGADANKKDPTNRLPVHWVSDSYAASRLAELTTDINQQEESGYTALHLAAVTGRFHVVAAFLKHGAHPGVLTPGGKNPLDLAAEHYDQFGDPCQDHEVNYDETLAILKSAIEQAAASRDAALEATATPSRAPRRGQGPTL